MRSVSLVSLICLVLTACSSVPESEMYHPPSVNGDHNSSYAEVLPDKLVGKWSADLWIYVWSVDGKIATKHETRTQPAILAPGKHEIVVCTDGLKFASHAKFSVFVKAGDKVQIRYESVPHTKKWDIGWDPYFWLEDAVTGKPLTPKLMGEWSWPS